MSGDRRLTPEDRAFFALVARAVFTNPFGSERAEADREIARAGPSAGGEAGLAGSLAHVARRLAELERRSGLDLRAYAPEDREVLEYALSFDLYYRTTDALDDLIRLQLDAGDEPCAVPFAAELLGRLRARGFDRGAALRRFELFFQIRRAFYFIDRALIGESACMRAFRYDLWNNLFTRDLRLYGAHLWNRMEDFSTLLLGETGTGKGAAANAIGRSGWIPFDARRGRFVESFTKAFVACNLSQHPEPLIESELFGHRKGAFTGAVDHYDGLFTTCSPHGAVFLDEIGEVSIPVQIKLLRILQERSFTPIGSHSPRRFRGRVIAATNRGLEELRGSGAMRDDFFYRLSSDVLVVPPLRTRLRESAAELEQLVSHALARMLGAEEPALVARVCETVERDLGRDYAWPGNVRELEQCVRRILLRGSYRGAPAASEAPARDAFLERVERGELEAKELLASYCAYLYRRLGSFGAVARVLRVDRRTAKKYVELAAAGSG